MNAKEGQTDNVNQHGNGSGDRSPHPLKVLLKNHWKSIFLSIVGGIIFFYPELHFTLFENKTPTLVEKFLIVIGALIGSGSLLSALVSTIIDSATIEATTKINNNLDNARTIEKTLNENESNAKCIAEAVLKNRANLQLTTKVIKELERILISATSVHGGGRVPMLTKTRYSVEIAPVLGDSLPIVYLPDGKAAAWYCVDFLSWNGFDFSTSDSDGQTLTDYFKRAAGFADVESGFKAMIKRLIMPQVVMPYSIFEELRQNEKNKDGAKFIDKITPIYPFADEDEVIKFGLDPAKKLDDIRTIPWVENSKSNSLGSQVRASERGLDQDQKTIQKLLSQAKFKTRTQFGVIVVWEDTSDGVGSVCIPFQSLYDTSGKVDPKAKKLFLEIITGDGATLESSVEGRIERWDPNCFPFLGAYVPDFKNMEEVLKETNESQIRATSVRMFQSWQLNVPVFAHENGAGDKAVYEGIYEFPSALFSECDFLDVHLEKGFSFVERTPVSLYGFQTGPSVNAPRDERKAKLPVKGALLTPSDQFVIKWRAEIPLKTVATLDETPAQAAE